MKAAGWFLAAAVLAGACAQSSDNTSDPAQATASEPSDAVAAETQPSVEPVAGAAGQSDEPQPSAAQSDDSPPEEEAEAESGAGTSAADAEDPGTAAAAQQEEAEAAAPVADAEEPVGDQETAPAAQEGAEAAAPAGGVVALLEGLAVRAEAERSGYDRGLFKHWVDADGDGCDTRREVLIAEAVTAPAVGSGCGLSGGSWYSPYDGGTETGTGSGFDIDHMVPLAEAWDSGAADWGPGRREDFANDLGYPDALVAVTARSNRSKADRDPGEWQPPDAAARCWYASAWVQVKTRWGLSVDQREADALRGVLTGCDTADMAAPAPVAAPASAPATSAPAAQNENSEDPADPPSETSETADLAALAELRSKPCGDWTAADRGLAAQAPDGYDWGRRDGNNDGEPCE